MTRPHHPRPRQSAVDALTTEARRGLDRVEAGDLPRLMDEGAFVVDTRTAATRVPEGHIPGAVVVDRLVLEWRLDPTSEARMSDGPTRDDVVVVVCNEGYSSSLAARELQRLGFSRATDLVGGFRAYAAAGLPIERHPTRDASTYVPDRPEEGTRGEPDSPQGVPHAPDVGRGDPATTTHDAGSGRDPGGRHLRQG